MVKCVALTMSFFLFPYPLFVDVFFKELPLWVHQQLSSCLLNRNAFASSTLLLSADPAVCADVVQVIDREDAQEVASASKKQLFSSTPSDYGVKLEATTTTTTTTTSVAPAAVETHIDSDAGADDGSDWASQGFVAEKEVSVNSDVAADVLGDATTFQTPAGQQLKPQPIEQQQQQLSSADFDIFGTPSISSSSFTTALSTPSFLPADVSLESEILASLQKTREGAPTVLPSGLSQAAESILSPLPDLSFMLSEVKSVLKDAFPECTHNNVPISFLLPQVLKVPSLPETSAMPPCVVGVGGGGAVTGMSSAGGDAEVEDLFAS
jgi:hypothetical protein